MTRLTTDLCRRFGIEHPIFGFAHDITTVAAIVLWLNSRYKKAKARAGY